MVGEGRKSIKGGSIHKVQAQERRISNRFTGFGRIIDDLTHLGRRTLHESESEIQGLPTGRTTEDYS